MSGAPRLSPRARRNFLLTSGWPLIECNRVSAGIFDEVGAVDDAGGGIARRCHALRHLAAVRNDNSDTAELRGSRFDLAFANDDQRVRADVAGHAKKILDWLALGGDLGLHFLTEHFRIELLITL